MADQARTQAKVSSRALVDRRFSSASLFDNFATSKFVLAQHCHDLVGTCSIRGVEKSLHALACANDSEAQSLVRAEDAGRCKCSKSAGNQETAASSCHFETGLQSRCGIDAIKFFFFRNASIRSDCY